MTRYLDTGVILKLYTLEPMSPAVRQFVVKGGEPLCFTPLHHSESVSALKLKVFRGECLESEAASAILDLEADLASGVLRRTAIDWAETRELCRQLSIAHAAPPASAPGWRRNESKHSLNPLKTYPTSTATRSTFPPEI